MQPAPDGSFAADGIVFTVGSTYELSVQWTADGVTTNETLGSVEKNTDYGIFGVARPLETGEPPCGGDALPAAGEGEIKKGQATILSNVEGCAVEEYTVEITQILPSAPDGRQLALKVTDERLMEKTGGIVQGMSGSPIIQDGKLIGAVTHVLVEDPERGYGVSIEEMLAAAG